jgi:2,3-bisphosphoglycerate-dependent phosphoglycerate mutase
LERLPESTPPVYRGLTAASKGNFSISDVLTPHKALSPTLSHATVVCRLIGVLSEEQNGHAIISAHHSQICSTAIRRSSPLITKLLLVRHGESKHNVAQRFAGWTDSDLTDHGLAQAAMTAKRISDQFQIDALYSSPLRRARHTADLIGQATNREAIDDLGLREINFGHLENLTVGDAERLFPDVWLAAQNLEDLTFGWPGGETRRDFFGRVEDSFSSIFRKHPGQTVAVVAHGGVLGTYLANLLHSSPAMWRNYMLHNCSLTELDLHIEGTATLVVCNDTTHLPSAQSEFVVAGTKRTT